MRVCIKVMGDSLVKIIVSNKNRLYLDEGSTYEVETKTKR